MEAVPFLSLARTGNVKKNKRCFLLQKPVHKKVSGVFVLRVGFFSSRVLPGDAAGGHLEMYSMGGLSHKGQYFRLCSLSESVFL